MMAIELLTLSKVTVKVWQSVWTNVHPKDTCYPVHSGKASASAETRSTNQYSQHPMHAHAKKVQPTSEVGQTVFLQHYLRALNAHQQKNVTWEPQ